MDEHPYSNDSLYYPFHPKCIIVPHPGPPRGCSQSDKFFRSWASLLLVYGGFRAHTCLPFGTRGSPTGFLPEQAR